MNMSVQTTGYVMIGKYYKEAPFDYEDELVEELMCRGGAGNMAIVGVEPMSDSSVIIGQILAQHDEGDEELTVIDFDYDRDSIHTAIIELGVDGVECLIGDVKIYAWTCYH
jgi:hypothetical protein